MKSLNGVAVVAAWSALAVGGAAVAQTTWTVCQDGSCDFTSIQAAVDSATAGDTIRVQPGLYAPFTINHAAISVVGEGLASEVIIDGGLSSRPIDIVDVLEPPGVQVANVTVTRGRVVTDNVPARGGGIRIDHSLVTLTNVEIRDCRTERQAGSTIPSGGGGLAISSSIVTISDSLIRDCHAYTHVPTDVNASTTSAGGGVYAFDSTIVITNTTIDLCTAVATTAAGTWQNIWARGGAVAIYESIAAFTRCTLAENHLQATNPSSGVAAVQTHGGAVASIDSELSLDWCTVAGNSGIVDSVTTWSSEYNTAQGGGLFLWNSSSRPAAHAIRWTRISGNSNVSGITAPGDSIGGGIYFSGPTSSLVLQHSAVDSNQSGTQNSTGLINGGGIFATSGSTLMGNDVVLCSNTTPQLAADINADEFATCTGDTCGDCDDCNTDGVPDLVEVLDGAPDCDANGHPDTCEYPGSFFVASPVLVGIDGGANLEHQFSGLPAATSTVRVTIRVSADLGGISEYLSIEAGGSSLGILFGTVGLDCPVVPQSASIDLSAASFNTLVSQGDLTIRLVPSAFVSASECPSSSAVIVLEHVGAFADCNSNGVDDRCDVTSLLDSDCNSNAIPDACEDLGDCDADGTIDACQIAANPEADKNGDGVLDACNYSHGDFTLDNLVDGADLAYLLSLWGVHRPIAGDFNGDDMVDGTDLAVLLSRWGPFAP
jgi:hypothetical protein